MTLATSPKENMNEAGRVVSVFSAAVLATVVIAATALYANINKPIWIDEFLHFAFGAYGSTGEAWRVITASINSINFNQTGVYMIVDFWLLKIFGASAFWLRAPSILGGLLLFAGAICVLRAKRFNLLWQITIVLLLMRQSNVSTFIGEARPYMPLAGCAVFTLAYYLTPPVEQNLFFKVCGVLAVCIGSSMHPYFLFYYCAIIALTYCDAISWNWRNCSVRGISRHCKPALFAAALCIYFNIGALTWIPRQPTLSFDPFQWIKAEALLGVGIYTHFEFFLGPNALPLWLRMVFATIIFCTIVILIIVSPRLRPALATPLALVIGSLVLSALLSMMSYRSHYWILQRQWIASVALTCIGSVWLCAAIANAMPTRARMAAIALVSAFALLRGEQAARQQIDKIAQWRLEQAELARVPAEQIARDRGSTKPEEFVSLANQNIRSGGPVWPLFMKYYAQAGVSGN